jgi:hypothetical protein
MEKATGKSANVERETNIEHYIVSYITVSYFSETRPLMLQKGLATVGTDLSRLRGPPDKAWLPTEPRSSAGRHLCQKLRWRMPGLSRNQIRDIKVKLSLCLTN